MVDVGPSTPRSHQLLVYWGAYGRAHGIVSSWIKDGDMVYNPYHYFMGPKLCLLSNGDTTIVVMLTKQLVVFVNHKPYGWGVYCGGKA